MKTVFALFALTATALAQKVTISAPAPNTEVKPGGNVVVALDRPASGATPSTDVAVMIGFQPCAQDGNCDAVSDNFARVLYHGPFTPKHIAGHSDISQNFTVSLPSNATAGTALLQIAHFYYVGAKNKPEFETLNTVIQVTTA